MVSARGRGAHPSRSRERVLAQGGSSGVGLMQDNPTRFSSTSNEQIHHGQTEVDASGSVGKRRGIPRPAGGETIVGAGGIGRSTKKVLPGRTNIAQLVDGCLPGSVREMRGPAISDV